MDARSASAGEVGPGAWYWYRRLLGYALPHWRLFLVAALCMAVYAATDTGFAALLQPMLDDSFVARDPQMIARIPLLLMGLFLVRGITGFLSTYGMSRVGRQVIEVLRGEVFARLLRLPVAFYDREGGARLVSTLIYNVEQVAQASTSALTILLRDSLTVIFLIAYMFWVSGWLAAMFFILGPVLALTVGYVSRRFRRINRRIQASMADITQVAGEAIEGQRVVKADGGEAIEQAAFEQVNARNRHQQMKLIVTTAANAPVVQFFAACVLALVIWLASQDRWVAAISPGAFVSFIGAMLLLLPPLKRLTNVNAVIQRGVVAAESIFRLLDAEIESAGGRRALGRARGEIRCEGLGFRYREGAEPVLQGIDLHIPAGETLAIVGRSGSGKSTLVSLLPRFYEPSAGRILLDGHPLADYPLAALRDQIALVGQEVVLFNDSIANNIAYGRLRGASREAIRAAAEAANAWEFIQALPDGLDTVIGSRGAGLSGGQRQRLAIARAILKDAPILIFDEATSALDNESERLVQQALERLMRGRTTLVIAHRLSTVEHADRILVLDQGRVVECGSHAELLAAGGAYAALHALQFSGTDQGPGR